MSTYVSPPYRLMARLEGGRTRVFSRRGHDWSERFPRICRLRGVSSIPIVSRRYASSGRPAIRCFLSNCSRSAGDLADGRLPSSIQTVVLARTDLLSFPDRRAIQAASVLGQRFSLPHLRALLQEPGYVCDTLVRSVLMRPVREGFQFAHALVRDGVYGLWGSSSSDPEAEARGKARGLSRKSNSGGALQSPRRYAAATVSAVSGRPGKASGGHRKDARGMSIIGLGMAAHQSCAREDVEAGSAGPACRLAGLSTPCRA